MTLREALTLYLEHASDLKPGTRKRLTYDVNRWERLGGPMDVASIDKHAVKAFRAAAAGLSPWSIEGTVSAILVMLRFLSDDGHDVSVPYAGRRLRRRKQLRHVPSVQDLARVFEECGKARYPVLSHCSTGDWWRAFLVTAYTTGLRLSDLLSLEWEHVGEARWLVVAGKTEKIQALPLLPCCTLALNRIRSPRERIFEVPTVRFLRRELRRMSQWAGVTTILPQAIRRTSANAYETARPGAGAMILGHALSGATAFYVSPSLVLTDAAAKLEIPPEFTGATPSFALR